MDDIHSTDTEESISDEIDFFLKTLEQTNIGNVIKNEIRKKIESATVKLSSLFTKQRELSHEDEVTDISEAQFLAKASFNAEEQQTNSKQDTLKIILLQKKVANLNKQIELAEQKARSVTQQWGVDKAKLNEDAITHRAELNELQTKLIVTERKLRLVEQINRDRNMVRPGIPVAPGEAEDTVQEDNIDDIEQIRQALAEALQELVLKKQQLSSTALQLSDTKMALMNALNKIEVLSQRVSDLVRNEDSLGERIDTLEKDEGNILKTNKMLLREIEELKSDYQREQRHVKQLEDSATKELKVNEDKVIALATKVTDLENKIVVLEREKDDRKKEMQNQENALKREAEYMRIEKEQIARDNNQLLLTLNRVASITQTISADFETHKESTDHLITTQDKRARTMQLEMKSLAKSIDELVGDAGKRAADMERILEEQKRAADVEAENFEEEKRVLNHRIRDLQKEMSLQEKTLNNKMAQALKEETMKREEVEKELTAANRMVNQLSDRIESLERSQGSSAVQREKFEKQLEELEKSKTKLLLQFAEANDANTALRAQIASAGTSNATLQQECSAALVKVNDLNVELEDVKSQLQVALKSAAAAANASASSSNTSHSGGNHSNSTSHSSSGHGSSSSHSKSSKILSVNHSSNIDSPTPGHSSSSSGGSNVPTSSTNKMKEELNELRKEVAALRGEGGGETGSKQHSKHTAPTTGTPGGAGAKRKKHAGIIKSGNKTSRSRRKRAASEDEWYEEDNLDNGDGNTMTGGDEGDDGEEGDEDIIGSGDDMMSMGGNSSSRAHSPSSGMKHSARRSKNSARGSSSSSHNMRDVKSSQSAHIRPRAISSPDNTLNSFREDTEYYEENDTGIITELGGSGGGGGGSNSNSNNNNRKKTTLNRMIVPTSDATQTQPSSELFTDIDIDIERVEEIVRQAIVTNNYYYSKKEGTFNNSYPVEEHLLADMVQSFHTLSQDVLEVMRNATGTGSASLLESSQQAELTSDVVLDNIEAMILKAAQDLIINMERSKERTVNKMKEEMQRDQLRKSFSREGGGGDGISSSSGDTEDMVTEAMALAAAEAEEQQHVANEQVEAFTRELKALKMTNKELEDQLTSALDQLEESKQLHHNDSMDNNNNEGMEMVQKLPASFPPIPRLTKMRRRASAQDTDMYLSAANAAANLQANSLLSQLECMSPRSRGQEIRKLLNFDEFSTVNAVWQGLSEDQKSELKCKLLEEIATEIKITAAAAEKRKQEDIKNPVNYQKTDEYQDLREELVEGKLQTIGEVRVDDFDRLRDKMFGPDELISLTIVEHRLRYGEASDAFDSDATIDEATTTATSDGTTDLAAKKKHKERTAQRRNYRMLMRSMEIQRELLVKRIVENIPTLDLLRYKHATDTALLQLTAMAAWRSLKYYNDGGVFKDVLSVHKDVIDRCITAAGGWQPALKRIAESADNCGTMETNHWPEFFRVKVLEVLRMKLNNELEGQKSRLNVAKTALREANTAGFFLSKAGMPFGSALDTDANKRRMDDITTTIKSKAGNMLKDIGYDANNSNIAALSASVMGGSPPSGQHSKKASFSAATPLPAAAAADKPTVTNSAVAAADKPTVTNSAASTQSSPVTVSAANTAAVIGTDATENQARTNTKTKQPPVSTTNTVRKLKSVAAKVKEEDDNFSIDDSTLGPNSARSINSLRSSISMNNGSSSSSSVINNNSSNFLPFSGSNNSRAVSPGESSQIQRNTYSPPLATNTTTNSGSIADKVTRSSILIMNNNNNNNIGNSSPMISVPSPIMTASNLAGIMQPPPPVSSPGMNSNNSTKSSIARQNAQMTAKNLKFNKHDMLNSSTNSGNAATKKSRHASIALNAPIAGSTAAAIAAGVSENLLKLAAGNGSGNGEAGLLWGTDSNRSSFIAATSSGDENNNIMDNNSYILDNNNNDFIDVGVNFRDDISLSRSMADSDGFDSDKDVTASGGTLTPSRLSTEMAQRKMSALPLLIKQAQIQLQQQQQLPIHERVIQQHPSNLPWMNSIADKVVLDALYGNTNALHLMHCLSDGIQQWQANQISTSRTLLQAARQWKLAPEIIDELVDMLAAHQVHQQKQVVQVTEIKLPAEVVELKNKFTSILDYIERLAARNGNSSSSSVLAPIQPPVQQSVEIRPTNTVKFATTTTAAATVGSSKPPIATAAPPAKVTKVASMKQQQQQQLDTQESSSSSGLTFNPILPSKSSTSSIAEINTASSFSSVGSDNNTNNMDSRVKSAAAISTPVTIVRDFDDTTNATTTTDPTTLLSSSTTKTSSTKSLQGTATMSRDASTRSITSKSSNSGSSSSGSDRVKSNAKTPPTATTTTTRASSNNSNLVAAAKHHQQEQQSNKLQHHHQHQQQQQPHQQLQQHHHHQSPHHHLHHQQQQQQHIHDKGIGAGLLDIVGTVDAAFPDLEEVVQEETTVDSVNKKETNTNKNSDDLPSKASTASTAASTTNNRPTTLKALHYNSHSANDLHVTVGGGGDFSDGEDSDEDKDDGDEYHRNHSHMPPPLVKAVSIGTIGYKASSMTSNFPSEELRKREKDVSKGFSSQKIIMFDNCTQTINASTILHDLPTHMKNKNSMFAKLMEAILVEGRQHLKHMNVVKTAETSHAIIACAASVPELSLQPSDSLLENNCAATVASAASPTMMKGFAHAYFVESEFEVAPGIRLASAHRVATAMIELAKEAARKKAEQEVIDAAIAAAKAAAVEAAAAAEANGDGTATSATAVMVEPVPIIKPSSPTLTSAEVAIAASQKRSSLRQSLLATSSSAAATESAAANVASELAIDIDNITKNIPFTSAENINSSSNSSPLRDAGASRPMSPSTSRTTATTASGSNNDQKEFEDSSYNSSSNDNIHIGQWIMSTNIRYCIKDAGVKYGTRLKLAPSYLNAPEVPGCDAVLFPSVLPIQQGLNLITGERCKSDSSSSNNSKQGALALPEDVLMLQIAEDTELPHGLTRVTLSPIIKLTTALQKYLQKTQAIPAGHQLVQILDDSPIILPVGVEVSPGVIVAATPDDICIPSNLRIVKNFLNSPLPSYMCRLSVVAEEEDDLLAELKMNEFCCIVKRPVGIEFGLGVEILQRPPGHPLPPGMTLLPESCYPDGLVLPEELELVQLSPRYDLPHDCRLTPEWKIWPRPLGMRLPAGVQIVYPDSTAAVPDLPRGVCVVPMPDLPYGIVLPPKSQAVEIFGSNTGGYPLPEGAILAPGITVLRSDQLVTSSNNSNSSSNVNTRTSSAATTTTAGGVHVQRAPQSARALNVLLVHRLPGCPLPPLVERGTKSDLPFGTLLAENMDIVRLTVRFELPPGVRIQTGAKLNRNVQIAPGTNLITLSGGQPSTDSSSHSNSSADNREFSNYTTNLEVLEWPHGVSLTPGTEFVRRPPTGYYLPFGYKELNAPRFGPALPNTTTNASSSSVVESAAANAAAASQILPAHGMLVQLPRAVHYASSSQIAEQVTVGMESMLDGSFLSLPPGMVLAARRSRNMQWPAEMTPVANSALGAKIVKLLAQVNSEMQSKVEPGSISAAAGSKPNVNGSESYGSSSAAGGAATDLKPLFQVEVVSLSSHFSLPPGAEILPGVVVQRKPYWLHAPSWVELVTKHVDIKGRPLPYCQGISRINLRPDYIKSNVLYGANSSSNSNSSSTNSSNQQQSEKTRTAKTTTASSSDGKKNKINVKKVRLNEKSNKNSSSLKKEEWELIDLEHASRLTPMSLPKGYELVQISPMFKNIYSWGSYLKGVEAITISQQADPILLPPAHYLIQRPLAKPYEQLPEGFQLGVAKEYSQWVVPSLPPHVEVMHIVPTHHLPMGINIMNSSVLSANQLNTITVKLKSKGTDTTTTSDKTKGVKSNSKKSNKKETSDSTTTTITTVKEGRIAQLLSGERVCAGCTVVAKPFGSLAVSELLASDPYYNDEAHAFIRIHDPKHFKLPSNMVVDSRSAKIVEAVFGKELLPEWRPGCISKHDIAVAVAAATTSSSSSSPAKNNNSSNNNSRSGSINSSSKQPTVMIHASIPEEEGSTETTTDTPTAASPTTDSFTTTAGGGSGGTVSGELETPSIDNIPKFNTSNSSPNSRHSLRRARTSNNKVVYAQIGSNGMLGNNNHETAITDIIKLVRLPHGFPEPRARHKPYNNYPAAKTNKLAARKASSLHNSISSSRTGSRDGNESPSSTGGFGEGGFSSFLTSAGGGKGFERMSTVRVPSRDETEKDDGKDFIMVGETAASASSGVDDRAASSGGGGDETNTKRSSSSSRGNRNISKNNSILAMAAGIAESDARNAKKYQAGHLRGLIVHPRLLQVHKEDGEEQVQDHEKSKFLTNVLVYRLMGGRPGANQPAVNEKTAAAAIAAVRGRLRRFRPYKNTDVLDFSLWRLIDLIDKLEFAGNIDRTLAEKASSKITFMQRKLDEVMTKNALYEKQLSYNDDLKALISRLNLKLIEKSLEVKNFQEQGVIANERMQSQMEMLAGQVAYYEDMVHAVRTNQHPLISHAGSSSSNTTMDGNIVTTTTKVSKHGTVEGMNEDNDDSEGTLTSNQWSLLVSQIHERYRVQILTGLEALSGMYADSLVSIATDMHTQFVGQRNHNSNNSGSIVLHNQQFHQNPGNNNQYVNNNNNSHTTPPITITQQPVLSSSNASATTTTTSQADGAVNNTNNGSDNNNNHNSGNMISINVRPPMLHYEDEEEDVPHTAAATTAATDAASATAAMMQDDLSILSDGDASCMARNALTASEIATLTPERSSSSSNGHNNNYHNNNNNSSSYPSSAAGATAAASSNNSVYSALSTASTSYHPRDMTRDAYGRPLPLTTTFALNVKGLYASTATDGPEVNARHNTATSSSNTVTELISISTPAKFSIGLPTQQHQHSSLASRLELPSSSLLPEQLQLSKSLNSLLSRQRKNKQKNNNNNSNNNVPSRLVLPKLVSGVGEGSSVNGDDTSAITYNNSITSNNIYNGDHKQQQQRQQSSFIISPNLSSSSAVDLIVPVSAEITAMRVSDYIRTDHKAKRMKADLQAIAGGIAGMLKAEFDKLLLQILNTTVNTMNPNDYLEDGHSDHTSQRSNISYNDSSTGIIDHGSSNNDISNAVSTMMLHNSMFALHGHINSASNAVTMYLKYLLEAERAHYDTSLHQLDAETGIMRRNLTASGKRCEMLELFLVEARKKVASFHNVASHAAVSSANSVSSSSSSIVGTTTTEYEQLTNDALREKIMNLEAKAERLLKAQVDPSVSVVKQMISRLNALNNLEKQLKFASLLYKQRAALEVTKLHAIQRPYGSSSSHATSNSAATANSLEIDGNIIIEEEDGDGDDDLPAGDLPLAGKLKPPGTLTLDQRQRSYHPLRSTSSSHNLYTNNNNSSSSSSGKQATNLHHVPSSLTVKPTDSGDVKALKHLIVTLRKKARICIERAELVHQECTQLTSSIMENMEAYQRSVQAVLPPFLLEQVLRWSVRSCQDSAAGAKVVRTVSTRRVSVLRAQDEDDDELDSEERRKNEDGSSYSNVNMTPSFNSKRIAAAAAAAALTDANITEARAATMSDNSSIISNASSSASTSHHPPNQQQQQLLRPALKDAQKMLGDATRTLNKSHVKFGAIGSMPPAPAVSHLLVTHSRNKDISSTSSIDSTGNRKTAGRR